MVYKVVPLQCFSSEVLRLFSTFVPRLESVLLSCGYNLCFVHVAQGAVSMQGG